MKNIIKSFLTVLLFSSLVIFSGCGIDNDGENTVPSGKNEFVKAQEMNDMNASSMLSFLNAYTDFNTTNAFGFESAFGYKSIKITYKTQDINGNDVNASGLLVIPTVMESYKDALASVGKQYSVSMICDNHGTIFTNAEAPSEVESKTMYPLAISMTGYAGFAGIYPDYVGYGSSNDSDHPYLIKKDSAKASLDMVKASIYYMEQNGIAVNYQLYISGYSQGAHVAMALAEEVQNNFNTVDLKGVAPMAGPYTISEFGDSILQSDATMSVPAFMAYVADSYSNAYEDVALEGMVLESKIPAFDGLFDGSNDATAIHTKLMLPLGAPTLGLFDADFISDYEASSEHALRTRFTENNVGNYAAKTKINLIHCSNDDVIPVEMTYLAKQILTTSGSTDVTQTIIEGVDANYTAGESVHVNCGEPAYQQAVGWFDAIRQGRI